MRRCCHTHAVVVYIQCFHQRWKQHQMSIYLYFQTLKRREKKITTTFKEARKTDDRLCCHCWYVHGSNFLWKIVIWNAKTPNPWQESAHLVSTERWQLGFRGAKKCQERARQTNEHGTFIWRFYIYIKVNGVNGEHVYVCTFVRWHFIWIWMMFKDHTAKKCFQSMQM